MASDASTYVLPDQSGKTVVITGANSGLGLVDARRLAVAGAQVVMACRNIEKAKKALESVLEAAPSANVSIVSLDLSSLKSVRSAAEEIGAGHKTIDILINNAGVMAIPRELTEDGLEKQFQTNHLGHFALTGLLLDNIEASGAGRVVSVSSDAHKMGNLKFDDLQGEKRYFSWLAYSHSKLANIYFALELQRRMSAKEMSTISLAAHPGYAATELQLSGRGVTSGPMRSASELANKLFGQSDEMGALPTLHAATSAEVKPGGYYGPGGLAGARGFPVSAKYTKRAGDPEAAEKLWDVSEELSGVVYPT